MGFSWPTYCTILMHCGPTYLETNGSCYGEAVARLQRLYVAAIALYAVGSGHLLLLIMMNKFSVIIDFHS